MYTNTGHANATYNSEHAKDMEYIHWRTKLTPSGIAKAGDDMERSRDGFAIAAMEARHCAAWSSHHVGRKWNGSYCCDPAVYTAWIH